MFVVLLLMNPPDVQQCVAVRYSVLQRVASFFECVVMYFSVFQRVAVCFFR